MWYLLTRNIVCVCVCACGGDPPFSRTENYGECDDISLERNHTSWWVCAWTFPDEFLDCRHMTAFLFANQTALIDRFRHVPSTVEKLPGKAISTTTHIHFTKGRGLARLKHHQNSR